MESRRSTASVKRSTRLWRTAHASKGLGDDLVLDGFEEGDGSGGIAGGGIRQDSVVEGDGNGGFHFSFSSMRFNVALISLSEAKLTRNSFIHAFISAGVGFNFMD